MDLRHSYPPAGLGEIQRNDEAGHLVETPPRGQP